MPLSPFAPLWSAPLLALLTSALILCLLLGPARARLPLDRPNERSLHHRPVPRTGGLAVVAGILAAAGAVMPSSLVLVGGTALLAATSFIDDWRGLPIALRFAIHTLVASAFVALALVDWPLPWQAASAFMIVWSMNLYNFMDGSDGLAGGMAVIGFTAYAAGFFLARDFESAALAASTAAAALVFLMFNFNPARIFLGDAGSIPLGFLAGALGAAGIHAGHWPLWFPFVVFAPFFVDATITLLRRMMRGEKFWHAHREHYYQRLVRLGWGHRRTALVEYALMAVSAAVALSALAQPHFEQLFLLAVWAAIVSMAMLVLDRAWQRAQVAARSD
ncbi:MAG: glycosyltransferase family 4 protein [Proteobacteria bacterium]|nr:glycosyltransferase family 4 protein [Burkholderiales bacterium]